MLTAFLSLIVAAGAFAGNGNVVGNGGNAIHCPAPFADSEVFYRGTAILDVAEGKSSRGYHYRALTSLRSMPFEEALPKAASRFLANAAFERATFLARFAARARNTRWVRNLPNLGVFSPWLQIVGCTPVQAAIQFGPERPSLSDALFLEVSAPVWSSLSTDQKVALFFHEYLLKDQLFRQRDCAVRHIRDLTAYVLSDEALAAKPTDWNAEVNRDCESDFLH